MEIRNNGQRTAVMPRNRRKLLQRSVLAVLSAALLALLLAGCGTAAPQIEAAEETPPPVYQVRYHFHNHLLQTQELTEGQQPTPLQLSLPGLIFDGWEDSQGRPIRTEKYTVSADIDLYAVVYPSLENHVPYLFADDDGFLHPDAPLTCQDLSDALCALAARAAEEFLPEIPASAEAIEPDAFREILLELFPEKTVDAACAAYEDAEQITRRDAAAIFNNLLGRSTDETVTLRRGAVLAPDISAEMPDYLELVEASVSHTADAWGETWEECAIPTRYEPGLLPLDGRLYYIDENGALLTDGEKDGFLFGPDGVYTSGDAELDAYVTNILGSIMREHPDAERIEWLREAYNYTRDSFTYFRKPAFVYGATDWEIECALDMLGTARGNCYDYAAVFWALARGLGYDARAYSGQISDAPHGWVEITIDETDYMFDPELEMAARLRGNYLSDRFMMTRLAASAYGIYRRP